MPIPSRAVLVEPAPPGAATLGVWVFLGSELMLFAPLLLAYVVCRDYHPDGFAAASRLTDFTLGTLNTVILLSSSMTMALAVHASGDGALRNARRWLWLTAALGLLFLILKGVEYRHDWQPALVPGLRFAPTGALAPAMRLFFLLYFGMTLLHALHLCVGIALTVWLAAGAPALARRCELAGLYWHFVDLLWIFLYPLLYLVGRSGGTA